MAEEHSVEELQRNLQDYREQLEQVRSETLYHNTLNMMALY